MFGSERRRQSETERAAALRHGLTPAQVATIETLEGFRWRLAFVRRPLFRDPVPVVLDRNGGRFVVVEPDGSINESSGVRIRGLP